MEILVLSLIAGVFVVGGLWMATRDTKPLEKDSDEHHAASKKTSE
jgi:hypothetical protein